MHTIFVYDHLRKFQLRHGNSSWGLAVEGTVIMFCNHPSNQKPYHGCFILNLCSAAKLQTGISRTTLVLFISQSGNHSHHWEEILQRTFCLHLIALFCTHWELHDLQLVLQPAACMHMMGRFDYIVQGLQKAKLFRDPTTGGYVCCHNVFVHKSIFKGHWWLMSN